MYSFARRAKAASSVGFVMASLGICLGLHTLSARSPKENTEQYKIKGRLLEACSCMVPCPCNFGQPSSPHSFCKWAAFFELQSGELDGVSLKGLQFAVVARGGSRAVLTGGSSHFHGHGRDAAFALT
jgi:hypothetical protein